jgi:hypothetical protein
MGEDARIIGYVFRDFVKQRIETAIKTIEEKIYEYIRFFSKSKTCGR